MSRTGRFFTAFLLTALVAAVFAGACAYNYAKESPAFSAVSEKSAEADGGQPRDAHTEDAVQSVPLACVMYHNILKSRKGTYIVSPSQFEDDLAAYRAAGYTTVFPSEVADFVYGNGALPEKPLLVTFDDGRYNNMYYGLPLLQKYGAKAVLCPVGAFSAFSTESGDHSNPNYSHVTWGQMDELQKSGCFELGNHSYNMHRYEPRFGIKRKAGESRAEYKEALRADAGRLQDEILRATGTLPVTYAYPFGAYCDDALAVLRSLGFRIFLTCNEGVSVIRRGVPETLFLVKRVNRDGALTSSEVVSRLEKFAGKAAARGNA